MLYLFNFFYFLLFVLGYLFIGALYVAAFHMIKDDQEWDNIIWLFWPIMAWRKWRLHRFNKYMNSKWER